MTAPGWYGWTDPAYWRDDSDEDSPAEVDAAEREAEHLEGLRDALRARHRVLVSERQAAWRRCWSYLQEIRDGGGPRSYSPVEPGGWPEREPPDCDRGEPLDSELASEPSW